MCAIAGILNLYADEQIVSAMLKSMRRRGPDGQGQYNSKGVCLLHSRLANIDAADGSQPIFWEQGNGRYVITFDGELYNSLEIAKELLALGHCFQSRSDAELVLHAYVQWKADALEKLNGVFAMAILEEQTGEVFFARDRIGVKPLFYMEHDGGLLFASEMKTILTYPTIRATLDEDGISQILLLGPGRRPGSGVFQNMRELEPGHYAIYRQGKLSVKQYWKLKDQPHRDNFQETVEKVQWLVKDAITRQMAADGAVGTFLSGGLDSSVVTAICASEMKQNGKQLHTFSLDYEDQEKYFTPEKFQPTSDTAFIRMMQSQLDCKHHWTVLKPEDLVDNIADATIARDLPGMADVDTSLLAFCKNIAPHVHVVLSGECADEIFGGYLWYRDPNIRNIQGFPWAQSTRERTAFLQPWVTEKVDPAEFVQREYYQSLAECDILPENNETEKRMKEMVNLNFRWFMQTLLDRQDRMSMYHGLIIRAPFSDYRIAEYLYRVPWEVKAYAGCEKGLLRKAMEGLLPDAILYRKKSPYPKTHHPAYLAMVSDLLRDLLRDPHVPILQIVRREALEDLLQQEFTWPWYGQLMRQAQTIVYMLQINYWLEHYSVRID